MRLYPRQGLGVAVMANTTSRYDFEPLFAEAVARCGRAAGSGLKSCWPPFPPQQRRPLATLANVPTMPLPSDLAIARAADLKPIADVADAAGIPLDRLEPYGRHVAKIDLAAVADLASRPRARYVVVTAITPTPLGEGKTTTAVGLAQALAASASARRSRSGSRRWVRRSASRAEPPVRATARSCRWRRSTCT